MSRPNLPPKQPAEHQIEFGGEISLAYVRCPGISADDKQATRWQPSSAHPGQITKTPPHPVSHNGPANATRNDESDSGRNDLIVPRRPGIPGQQVHGEQPARCALTFADRQFELLAPPHPGRSGKHEFSPSKSCALGEQEFPAPAQPPLRRSGLPGPYRGARPGSPAPRAFACATGTRASSPDGGWSAEMCAYSLRLQVLLIWLGHG
jgi:hypothetical protein